MSKERKAFNFFKSYFDVYVELSDKDKVRFMDALLKRQFLGVEPSDLKGMSNFAYISQKHSIDAQVKGYEDKTGVKLSDPNQPPSIGGTNTPAIQGEGEGKEKGQEQGEQVYSDEVHACYDFCYLKFPEHLRPKDEKEKNNWIDTIDKLNRIDNIPFDIIEKITAGARASDFWAKNFLSLTKLRKKNKEGIAYIVVFNEHLNKKNGKQTSSQAEVDAIIDQHCK